MFTNKTLLITGGTGSFGSTVLKRFLKTDIAEIRVFSRDEKKQEELRNKLCSDKVKYFIGDVRDKNSVNEVIKDVNVVFHAAALKQVPSCEFYPMEAVKTNINGTENILNAAIENKVSNVVVLSTDKAVYPINAMGLTKAIAEKICIAKSRLNLNPETVICATRYGNVMASRGSVIPLFLDQIKRNKPITITDPKMTRFLMSLEESVSLVIHAFKNAKGGDIYVQQSPASTIGDLAQALIEIFNSNSEINIIGTRHGEKLYETLLTREEVAKSEKFENYYRIPIDSRDLNYSKYFFKGKNSFSNAENYTSHNTRRLNVEEIKKTLLQLSIIKDLLNA